jgi:hypothetical protein
MNRVYVELTGRSPMIHNRIWSDGSGWTPATDREQAESRLWGKGRLLYLPPCTPVVAIGRAAHSKGVRGAKWPTEIKHARDCESLAVDRVAFEGEWTPQVFLRRDLPAVALPRFDEWNAAFDLDFDPAFHRDDQLREMLDHSGRHLGLPVFAPFAGPGPWGRFEVSVWEPARVGRDVEAA